MSSEWDDSPEQKRRADVLIWLLDGGGGHEGGVSGLQAMHLSGDGLIDFLSAYQEHLEVELATPQPSAPPTCTICGHSRDLHSMEMPYDCQSECGCSGFSYVTQRGQPSAPPAGEREIEWGVPEGAMCYQCKHAFGDCRCPDAPQPSAHPAGEQTMTVREQLNGMFGKDKVDYAIAEAKPVPFKHSDLVAEFTAVREAGRLAGLEEVTKLLDEADALAQTEDSWRYVWLPRLRAAATQRKGESG